MATVYADSATYAHVAAAITSADVGDSVIVPAGTETWNTALSITKGVHLKGDGIGSTVITSNVSNTAVAIIKYEPATPGDNEAFSITGFTIDGDDKSGCLKIKNTSASSPLTEVRVYLNRFTQASYYGLAVQGTVYGVADNNTFDNNYVDATVFAANQSTYDAQAASYGTSHAFFIEDNTFSAFSSALFYGSNAGQYVFRYNTITNLPDLSGILDQHGNNHDPVISGYTDARAPMNGEVYENSFTSAHGARTYIWMHHRGGALLMYNNTLTGAGGSSFIRLTEYDITIDNLIPAIVSHEGTNYICLQDHTSSAGNEPGTGGGAAYWAETVVVPQVYIVWAAGIDFLYSTAYDPIIDTYFDSNLVGGVEAAVTPEGDTGTYWIEDTNYYLKTPIGETIKGAVYAAYTYPHPLQNTGASEDPPGGMIVDLKQSTAKTLKIGPFLDTTNGDDAEVGLTIEDEHVLLSKNGGAFTAKQETTSCTHDTDGMYGCPLGVDDTDTLGTLQLKVHFAGALYVWHDFNVITANEYDRKYSTDKLQVDVVQIAGAAVATGTAQIGANVVTEANIDFGALKKTSLDAATPTVNVGSEANIDFGALKKASLKTATQATVMEGTITLQEAVNIILAFVSGKSNGAGTVNVKFRDTGDTKDRIDMTVDGDGDRSAVTRDGS